jgi:hypothetical protein
MQPHGAPNLSSQRAVVRLCKLGQLSQFLAEHAEANFGVKASGRDAHEPQVSDQPDTI